MKSKDVIKDKNLRDILDDIEKMATTLFGDKLKEIILYGSYARNNQIRGSDIDFMFLFNEDKNEIIKYRDKISDIMVDLSLKYDILISISEASILDFNEYVSYVPFYSNVYNEGIEIYAGR